MPASRTFYVVFARLEGEEKKFIAAVVDAENPGLTVSERIAVNAPHPLGTIDMEACRVPASAVLGEPGKGMRVALGTLDIFRSTVGAAALGFARRALAEATRARGHAAGVRPAARGFPADAGEARGDGAGGRRERAARVSRGVDARHGRGARHA